MKNAKETIISETIERDGVIHSFIHGKKAKRKQAQKKPEIVYYYRGMIERLHIRARGGLSRGIVVRGEWLEAYSPEGSTPGSVLYNWLPKRECKQEAASQGCVARFVR